ncbi:MAG: hypothetical protein A3F46_03680 [Legionellales bacterium RIFCSPHIGHO2_12_FULL_42_9]|nr:MAG: hypothetical protein A3F46_03680 [Legionellales bacterium RIFCSPHIGHO2_12_FULL_42_9]
MSNNQKNALLIQKKKKSAFTKKVILNGALACNNIIAEDFDVNRAKAVTEQGMTALDIHGGLQTMLAAQMLSIHNLQQRAMAYVNGVSVPGHKTEQYYTNTTIKLANCFVQQAALLAKLQGMSGQQVIVKHVEVNQGGQAIVGNIGDLAQHKAKNENNPTDPAK